MTLKTTKLRDAITFALVAGATAVTGTGVAFAQDSEATTLDRIEVTGSRIRQADIETAQPVFTISRQDIENQGFASVGDILQNITAAGSPPISRSEPLASGENVGGQYVDLRSLGATRTLVLVNGRRLPITTSGYQDISAIPSIMVERIDVLKDGASSIYGSDAIAGVINIITRRNYEGVEGSVYYGQFSDGDGAKTRIDGVLGISSDRGYITVGAEYREEEEVWARDRYYTADSRPGFPASSLTTVGQWGNFWNPNAGDEGEWWAPDRGSNAIGVDNFHPQTSDDTSNSADQMHARNPLEARSLFVSGGYDITDRVQLVADMSYQNRRSTRQIAGYPLQSAAFDIPMAGESTRWIEHPITGELIEQTLNGSYFNPLGDQDIDWRRRGWEVPRTTASELSVWRFSAALEGSFEFGDRYIDWQVGNMYSDSDLSVSSRGDFHTGAVGAAVGPSFINDQGQLVCGTQGTGFDSDGNSIDEVIAGCVPWNPFAGSGTGAVANSLDDPDIQRLFFPTFHDIGSTTTHSYFANISGNLFALPAGDLSYAAGYEYRKEKGGYTPDALLQSGVASGLAAGPTYGEYKVDEFFLELDVPLLSGVTGAQELTVNLASRYSDYDTFGDTVNSKFGVKWKPIDDLLVRATWAQGFRAPSISNLYSGGSQTFTTGFRDPCDSVYGDARGTPRCLQDVAADYRQLKQGFVPTDGPADQTPVPFNSGPNPLLQPERSRSWTAGLVYSPGYAQGLDISLDWWKIRIDDTMVSDSPNAILSDCYISLIESRCAMFERDPSNGIVNQLSYGLRNAGFSEVEGFDFGVGYRWDTNALGAFAVNWDSTYFSSYDYKSTNDADAPVSPQVGFGSEFRIRSNLNLNWTYGDFGASWSMRYNSGTKENCYYSHLCTNPDYQAPDTQGNIVPQNRIGSVTFNDVQVRWNAPWNATVSIGANNVLGKEPPIYFSQPNSNYSFYGGHDMGRFMYMKYQQRF